MVLDVRRAGFAEPEVASLPVEKEASADLDELLTQAVCGQDAQTQIKAVQQLRLLVPTGAGLERLREIVEDSKDERRLLAAQVLGFHRQWLSSRLGPRRVAELARRESDAAVRTALVWCLRQREEIGQFLGDAQEDAAREAALGVPISRHTLDQVVEAFLAGLPPQVERLLLGKLRGMHPSLLGPLMELLIERFKEEDQERYARFLAALPELPLFDLFLEEGGRPLQELEEAERARAWQQLGRLAAQVLQERPSVELLRHLLRRSSADEAFCRRHAAFLRAALQRADAGQSAELIDQLEHLSFRASEDMVARLAQLLMELNGRFEGQAHRKAASLLEEWKSRSATLKLKIYHLEQGLKP